MKRTTLLTLLLLFTAIISYAGIDFTKIEKSIVKVYRINYNKELVAEGSGFFIDSVTIVTNYHVLFSSEEWVTNTWGARIELNSGEIIYGYRVWYDKEADIALIKIESKDQVKTNLPIARRKVKIGEAVWAVGNPQGLANSWSNGIVSAARVSDIRDTIYQFTAPISEGSSGGPVLNDVGQVIGISTFKMREGESLNFFIGISRINRKLEYRDFLVHESKDFDAGNTAANYENLAKKAYDNNQYLEALTYLEKALQVNGNSDAIFIEMAKNYLALNKLKEVEDCIHKAENANRFFANISFQLDELRGSLHFRQGRYNDAANDYLKWSEHISIYDNSETVMQWGYFKAAYCYNEAAEFNKAKYYIAKVTDTNLMDFSFYQLRSLIYMKLAKLGDKSITQNMVCSDLMKVKNILEKENDFDGYKTAQRIFEQVCK